MIRLIAIILLFVIFILFWAFCEAIFMRQEMGIDKDKISTMRIDMKKQDDAIRRKQNKIDELEREIRREKRKK